MKKKPVCREHGDCAVVFTGGYYCSQCFEEDKRQCLYIYAVGKNKGKRCKTPSEPGIGFCRLCKGRPANLLESRKTAPRPLKSNYSSPSSYKLRFNSIKDLSAFRENEILTDIILVSEGVSVPAHKFVLLVASPYFEKMFNSGLKEQNQDLINLHEITPQVLQQYLDLIYGKEISIEDWKTAFDLFDYFDTTLLSWHKDQVVTRFLVQPEEYSEYIRRLDRLYSGEIPEEIVKKTTKYITSKVDLCEFDEAFVKIIQS